MTVRIVTTPLDGAFVAPAPRTGGIARDLLPAFVRVPGAADALAALDAPDALVVTTGQQPGLFTGPLYTIHKALSAAALASLLAERWGRPVVPVFWMAGDDHDFAEASQVHWLASDGTVRSGALPPRAPDAPLTPLYREPLGAGVEAVLAALEADLPASEFRAWTIEWLRRHYRPDATFSQAFSGALGELLAPHGVVLFDSTYPAVKRAARPHLVRALELAPELDRALAALGASLATEEQDPGVALGDGATLVFLECRMGRDRLILRDGQFTTRRGHAAYDLAALEQLAAEEPERFSPNVLLRPALESVLLPTVAYVGGPGELRYLRLTPPVYERLGIARQAALPRWSGVLVEPRVDRVLQKFGVTLEELMQPPGPLEARLVRSQLPQGAVDALAALRQAIEREYTILGRAAADVDPTLEKTVEGAKHHALAGIHDVERKLVSHLKKRAEIELGQVARARSAVWPQGKLQERVLTVAPFLARFGPHLLTELAAHIRRWYAAALERAPAPS